MKKMTKVQSTNRTEQVCLRFWRKCSIQGMRSYTWLSCCCMKAMHCSTATLKNVIQFPPGETTNYLFFFVCEKFLWCFCLCVFSFPLILGWSLWVWQSDGLCHCERVKIAKYGCSMAHSSWKPPFTPTWDTCSKGLNGDLSTPVTGIKTYFVLKSCLL